MIARFEHEADAPVGAAVLDPKHAFVTYLGAIDHWRRLTSRDPGLPEELFDTWNAPAAERLSDRFSTLLEDRAPAHAATHW